MKKALKDELKFVIESQHGGNAALSETVHLSVPSKETERWDGTVYIFDLRENRSANRAYAWALPISGGTGLRYFAVLHMGLVTNPLAAVKFAATAMRKSAPGAAAPKSAAKTAEPRGKCA